MFAVVAVADVFVVAAFAFTEYPLLGGVHVPDRAVVAHVGVGVDIPQTVVADIVMVVDHVLEFAQEVSSAKVFAGIVVSFGGFGIGGGKYRGR